MRRMLRLLVLSAVVSAAATVWSQDLPNPSASVGGGTRTINGTVVLRGSAVGNPQVTIENTNRSFRRTLFADSGGSFVISGVPGGGYWITIEAEGYLPLREQLEVPRGSGMIVVQYLLRPAPSVAPGSSTKPSAVSVATLRIPADARREFDAGVREMDKKRWNKAREHFEKALRKHPQFAQALGALAWIDLAENQTQHALERLHRAVEIDASYADGYLLLSGVLNRMGKHTEALEAGKKGVALRPDVWEMQYELGMAALSLGLDGIALECSERIESVAGAKVPDWRLLRAGVYLRRARYSEARAQLLAFLETAPNHRHAPLARQTLHAVEEKLSTSVP